MKRLSRYEALQKAHIALDDAANASGMTEKQVGAINAIMGMIRVMMNDSGPEAITPEGRMERLIAGLTGDWSKDFLTMKAAMDADPDLRLTKAFGKWALANRDKLGEVVKIQAEARAWRNLK